MRNDPLVLIKDEARALITGRRDKPAPVPASQVSRAMLLVLNQRQENIYAGTVPVDEIARRRAANKVARQSRRINRLRSR